MSAARPVVAIVGRPNVGKSTLFNRLLGRRRAIVEDSPGVTRDRHHADATLLERPVTLVDTGGFVPDAREGELERHVRTQAQAAIEAGDVVLFVVDGKTGLAPADADVARALRTSRKPVVVVVNKCDDHRTGVAVAAEFYPLGLGEPRPVSAEHNEGVAELVDTIVGLLPPAPPPAAEEEEPADRPVRVAVVGRPNVGKSTLVNALLRESRVIVSPVAGTTRDPIDTALTFKGRAMVLTDTAGIRRKAAITHRVEHFSVLQALRAAEDADVVVLVLDATEPAVDQDLKIAALAEEKGRALLICVNKWDLVKGTATEADFRAEVKWYMKWVSWAPMVFVSAALGHKVDKVLEVAVELFAQQYFRAPTPLLNRVVEHVTTEHPLPALPRGRQLRLYYAAQVGTAPVAFAFTCNAPSQVPPRYVRYLSNHVRTTFRLKVPMRLFFRERPGQKQRAEVKQRFVARHKHKQRRRARS